jgi:DNA-binding MarR family transcriptional regulator
MKTSKPFVAAFESGLFRAPQLLLLVLGNKRGLGWTPKQVSEFTGMSMNNVNSAKTALKKQGLIREQYPHRDGRSVKLYLTEAGQLAALKQWDTLSKLLVVRPKIATTEPTEFFKKASSPTQS